MAKKKVTKSKVKQDKKKIIEEKPIIEKNVAEAAKDGMVKYAIEVNLRRAIPDVRDGLKLIQRRIIYDMYFELPKSRDTLIKSARVVGDVMGKLHAHGDCLRANTTIYGLDGKIYTIKDLYESGVNSLEILSFDNLGHIVPAVAHSFRIGQYTDKVYHIKFSNGADIQVTANHPFLTPNNGWVKAEDLEVGTLLYGNIDNSDIKYQAITDLYIEEVDKEPMYDFTVDEFENMLIPLGDPLSNGCPFICVHNSSIYGAMKPLCNDFESKIPLLVPHGNFGNFQGESPAAMRYTEAKLSDFAKKYVIGDMALCKDVVDWIPTFDESSVEPEFLPEKVPLLLINGSSGIGVGIKNYIPPHNLGEVIDATLQLMDNPNSSILLYPDFCFPCDIVDNPEFIKCNNETGHCKFTARGRMNIIDYDEKPYKGQKAIQIVSIPDLTYLNTITNRISSLIEKGTLPQIQDMFDCSTDDNMNYIIIIKKGADAQYVVDMIYKHTAIQSSYTTSFEIIYGIESMRSNMRDYLLTFINLDRDTKLRLYYNLYKQNQTKLHEKQAYIDLLTNNDVKKAMKYIEGCTTIDENRDIEYMIKTFNITDLQAKFVLNASNKTHSKAYLDKYVEEAKGYEANCEFYKARIFDQNILDKEIKEELLAIKAKYATPRICRIVKQSDVSNIPTGTFRVVITNNNFIRKIIVNDKLKCSRAKGSDGTPKLVMTVDNTDNLILFDNMGRVYKYPIHKISLCGNNDIGIDIRMLIKNLTADVLDITTENTLKNLCDKGYYITMVSEGNKIKRIMIEDILSCSSGGLVYTKLGEGDRVKDVSIVNELSDVITYTNKKALRMSITEIPCMKRNTMGNMAMNTKLPIEGLSVMYEGTDSFIVLTNSGRINKFSASLMPQASRNTAGMTVIKLGKGDSINSIHSCDQRSVLVVTLSDGSIEQIPIASLDITPTTSTGQKILSIKSGVQILNATIEQM